MQVDWADQEKGCGCNCGAPLSQSLRTIAPF